MNENGGELPVSKKRLKLVLFFWCSCGARVRDQTVQVVARLLTRSEDGGGWMVVSRTDSALLRIKIMTTIANQ